MKNLVMLIGRLGQDPEFKKTNTDNCVATFSLATKFKDKTEWHRIKAFGKTAENIAKILQKGHLAYVEGSLHYSTYEKNGVTMYSTNIIANQFLALSPKNSPQSGESMGSAHFDEPDSSNFPDDSDLPF